eukprot:TRINITY_DN95393_c0_g1_i1.p1 TRINITY_DN95393_c0_g1~~TRINITY_DN95393_c0_g1_i1.p1  ORF type:complete len:526 (-),score=102.21 TRINITY_DN95393_c0_g1_i1:100-1644(-)
MELACRSSSLAVLTGEGKERPRPPSAQLPRPVRPAKGSRPSSALPLRAGSASRPSSASRPASASRQRGRAAGRAACAVQVLAAAAAERHRSPKRQASPEVLLTRTSSASSLRTPAASRPPSSASSRPSSALATAEGRSLSQQPLAEVSCGGLPGIETAQEKALKVLVKSLCLQGDLSISDIAVSLLGSVFSKEGGAAFSQSSVLEAVAAVSAGTSLSCSPECSVTASPSVSRSCSPRPPSEIVSAVQEHMVSALHDEEDKEAIESELCTLEAAGAKQVPPLPQLLTAPQPHLKLLCPPKQRLLELPRQAERGLRTRSPSLASASSDVLTASKRPSSARLLVQVIRVLVARHGNLTFGDVAGQILFKHRRSAALQERKEYRRTAEDLSWILCPHSSPHDTEHSVLDGVDGVFKILRVAGEMRGRQWQRVVQLMLKNPVLESRIRLSDADRLFYEVTHRDTAQASHGLRMPKHFRELLVALAECAGIHPAFVFVAVGCHSESLAQAKEDESAKQDA